MPNVIESAIRLACVALLLEAGCTGASTETDQDDDVDNDGWTRVEDCDDSDSDVHPGASETPDDGVDQDCSGYDTVSCFEDEDGDGYGSSTSVLAEGDCSAEGLSSADDDCNPNDPDIFPGATESCDWVDSDCDGSLIDAFSNDDSDDEPNCIDEDDDDDGDPDTTDCDDDDDEVYTDAPEVPDDGIDQDCNGYDTVTCFEDEDGDGFGSSTEVLVEDNCSGEGLSDVNTDCGPNDETVHPGATEACDLFDTNCNGSLVDGFVDTDLDALPDCVDSDDDGDGDPDATDCDDANAAIYTGATEIPDDDVDWDCNGFDGTGCYEDADDDGYAGTEIVSADDDCSDAGEFSVSSDCDDEDATIHPNATESCDLFDSDCDASIVDGFIDTDLDEQPDCVDSDDDDDGDPDVTDCDDTDPDVYAGASESPDDGVDGDCNGYDGTNCYDDGDGDFYGASTLFSDDDDCSDSSETPLGDDCDDSDGTINPAATESELTECMDDIDQDCDDAVDFDDDTCACAAVGASLASTTFTCPSSVPVTGSAGAFQVLQQAITFKTDPALASLGYVCSPPVLVRTSADIRGFTVGIAESGIPGGGATPYWAGSSLVPTKKNTSEPSPNNCEQGGTSSCAFPGTPTTTPGVGCIAISWLATAAADGTATTAYLAIDRTSASADRIDIHAVTAGETDISEEQIIDALSYAAQAFETQGLSLGTVSFEAIDEYADFALSQVGDVAAAPTRSGATDRAITVIFVSNISTPEGVIGYSTGVPGLIGTSGTAGSAVVVEVSTFLESDPPELAGLGLDIAHEVGHYLGLRHTTEINWDPTRGWIHDFLPDTGECTPSESAIASSLCVGAGADNVMFPILDKSLGVTGFLFSDQQGDVISSTAPGPAIACSSSSTCGDDEICDLGACQRAWARMYTLYLDGASVAATGPYGEWDTWGGAPDPFLETYVDWESGDVDSVSATESDTYLPLWYEDADVLALKSATDADFSIYDEDVTYHDLIEEFYEPAPLPIDWLRSPYLSLTGTYATLDIGFEPK